MTNRTKKPHPQSLEIILPATSANLGPAFDAAALAFSMFLKVRAKLAGEFSVTARGRDRDICGRIEDHLILTTYREVLRSVWLGNEPRQRVSALTYVVDRGHVQYAGRLSLAEQLRLVQQGHGRSGNNRDYVLSTVRSIEAQGFRDAQLHQLAMMLHGEATVHR